MKIPPPSIHLVCPYPLDSAKGNAVSARRIIGVLEGLGVPVTAGTTGEGVIAEADVLIAMHATRSHGAAMDYLAKNPKGKLVVLLTGTDLYRDLAEGNETCKQSMDAADILVVTQDSSLNSVPEQYRGKAMVVTKFVDLAIPSVDRSDRHEDHFIIETVFHGRWVKNPFLLLQAIARLPELENLRVNHVGSAREDAFATEAHRWLAREPRYRWLGEIPREETLRQLQLADLTVNTSRVEGGANAIIEAVMCGVPLLATAIEPTIGQLGSDYPGLFPSEDERALATLIRRCYSDADFVDELRQATIARRAVFTREAEAAGWLAVIERLVAES